MAGGTNGLAQRKKSHGWVPDHTWKCVQKMIIHLVPAKEKPSYWDIQFILNVLLCPALFIFRNTAFLKARIFYYLIWTLCSIHLEISRMLMNGIVIILLSGSQMIEPIQEMCFSKPLLCQSLPHGKHEILYLVLSSNYVLHLTACGIIEIKGIFSTKLMIWKRLLPWYAGSAAHHCTDRK